MRPKKKPTPDRAVVSIIQVFHGPCAAMTGDPAGLSFGEQKTQLLSQKKRNNYKSSGPSFNLEKIYRAAPSQDCRESTVLPQSTLKSIRCRNKAELGFYGWRNCTVVWPKLSTSHSRQYMTLFFELSIFVILFSALIFFIEYCHYFWHTR